MTQIAAAEDPLLNVLVQKVNYTHAWDNEIFLYTFTTQ